MKPFDIENPRFRLALIYPIQSMLENPPRGWIAGISVALLQWVVESRVMWLAIITAAALGFIDQYAGEKLARLDGVHNATRADHGMYGKQIGIILMFAMIPFEMILSALIGHDLNGALPTATAAWIGWHEYESLHDKYTTSGKTALPIVSHVAKLLRRVTDAIGEKRL